MTEKDYALFFSSTELKVKKKHKGATHVRICSKNKQITKK
jgi:hypothetical protein